MINPIDKKIFLNSHQEIINIGKEICDNLQDHRFAKNFYTYQRIYPLIRICKILLYKVLYSSYSIEKNCEILQEFKNLRRNLKYICEILHNNALLYYNTSI